MDPRPLRIEMVLPALDRAGMETVTATLGEGLMERGHDVGFTCIERAGELGEELVEKGHRVSVVPAPGLRPNIVPTELAAWFAELRPDVVHAHSGVWLKAVQGARKARVPRVVFTPHGIRSMAGWHLHVYGRVAAARTDHIVAVSEPLAHHVIRALKVPPERVAVVPNGVATDTFRPGPPPADLRASLGIPEGAVVIGNVARFDPVKNHTLLIDAFARLREYRDDVFLLLVGDGTCRAEIEAQVAALGLGPHVRMTGVVRGTAPLYRVMDVFALSSHTEGTSISLLEAMASGVPVVATSVGGNPALLERGRRGLLTPPGDAAALADALHRVLSDPELRTDLVDTAIRAVEDRYSVPAMVRAYERVYRGGAGEPEPTRALAADLEG